MTKFSRRKYQRHTSDRAYQTAALIVSQICLFAVRNRIEGYKLEKLKLAFFDTEITILAYIRLHTIILITCIFLMIVNMVGLYWESKEDPEKAALDAQLRKKITCSSFCMGFFFTLMTTIFGLCLLLFYGFRTRAEFTQDQLEANELCSQEECDDYQSQWIVDYDLIYFVIFMNVVTAFLEFKKLVIDFWPLIKDKPCV